MFLSESFNENVEKMNSIFENCADIKQLDVVLKYQNNARGRIYFVQEAVNDITVRDVAWGLSDVEELEDFDSMVRGVLSGNAVLIVEGKRRHSKSEEKDIRTVAFQRLKMNR